MTMEGFTENISSSYSGTQLWIPNPLSALQVRTFCDIAETIIFLMKTLSYYMALNMGKKTRNNHIFVEYLGPTNHNLQKAKEFIDLAAEELCAYQEEARQGNTSK